MSIGRLKWMIFNHGCLDSINLWVNGKQQKLRRILFKLTIPIPCMHMEFYIIHSIGYSRSYSGGDT